MEEGELEYSDSLEVQVWNPASGYRTCTECGSDCEPEPSSVDGFGIRVMFVCPNHGVHSIVDPFQQGQ